MKKLVCAIAGILSMMVLSAGQEDPTVEFKSEGPDRYMDDTYVLDGEFYALVWVPDAANVPEYSANGQLLSSDGCKILTAGPWASNKGCGDMVQVVPGVEVRQSYSHTIKKSVFDTLKNGSFRLCLLDTRMADNKTLSEYEMTAEGYNFPKMINGYVTTAKVSGEAAVISTSVNIDSPIKVATVSTVPAGIDPPVIVKTTLRGEGKDRVMDIEVDCTYEYLRYTAAAGSTPDGIGTADAPGATAANGDRTKRIVITVPATENSQFFRLIRKN